MDQEIKNALIQTFSGNNETIKNAELLLTNGEKWEGFPKCLLQISVQGSPELDEKTKQALQQAAAVKLKNFCKKT